jgi:hypothetical protein
MTPDSPIGPTHLVPDAPSLTQQRVAKHQHMNARERWLSAAAVRLHITLVLGVTGCALAGWFELTRALHGRELAWVYSVEWPFFGVVGSYIWWRLLHPDQASGRRVTQRAEAGGSDTAAVRAAPKSVSGSASGEAVDPDLLAWQRYLAHLQAIDPPGRPPER